MSYIIFVDTETTGLPVRGVYPDIVSIAWICATPDGKTIKCYYSIIKPYYGRIPEESQRIHGIRHEFADVHGEQIENVMKQFVKDASSASQIVAHNIAFDLNVIAKALVNCKLHLNSPPTFCTMELGKVHTKIPGIERGKYRCPRLGVLYKHFFGEEPSMELHNALNDANVCMKIYFKMVDLPAIPVVSNNVLLPPISAPKTIRLDLSESN